MTPRRLFQTVFFQIRIRAGLRSFVRRLWWQMQGARIGHSVNMPVLHMTWPHQVSIGDSCILEPEVTFKFDGYWKPGPSIVIEADTFIGRGCEFNIRRSITVGSDTLIASGCKFIDHDHDVPPASELIGRCQGAEAGIEIGDNVWLGANVVVLKGVTIGRGAIVGAGAVVTKSIPAFEIWAGVPARKIGQRPAGTGADKKIRFVSDTPALAETFTY